MYNIEDRENVRELHARYAHTIDEGRLEEWTECFTPDGVFQAAELGRFEGRPAMLKMARDYRASLNGAQQRHIMSNVSFKLEGDRGEGTCNLSHYITRDGVTQMHGIGVYRDRLRKIGNQWLFESRIVLFDTAAGLPGSAASR
jgi:3-phenylpropionate/cinnamic acid dioxygenase small subunit